MSLSADRPTNWGYKIRQTAGRLAIATTVILGTGACVEDETLIGSSAQLADNGQQPSQQNQEEVPDDIQNIMRNEFFEDWRFRMSVLRPDNLIMIGSWGKQKAQI